MDDKTLLQSDLTALDAIRQDIAGILARYPVPTPTPTPQPVPTPTPAPVVVKPTVSWVNIPPNTVKAGDVLLPPPGFKVGGDASQVQAVNMRTLVPNSAQPWPHAGIGLAAYMVGFDTTGAPVPWTVPSGLNGTVTLFAEIVLKDNNTITSSITFAVSSGAVTPAPQPAPAPTPTPTPKPPVVVVPSGRTVADFRARAAIWTNWSLRKTIGTRADNPVSVDALLSAGFAFVIISLGRYSKAEVARLKAGGIEVIVYIDMVECPPDSPYKVGSVSGYWGTTPMGDITNPGFFTDIMRPKLLAAAELEADFVNLDDYERGWNFFKRAMTPAEVYQNSVFVQKCASVFPAGYIPNIDGSTADTASQHPDTLVWDTICGMQSESMSFEVMDQDRRNSGRTLYNAPVFERVTKGVKDSKGATIVPPLHQLNYANLLGNAQIAQGIDKAHGYGSIVNVGKSVRDGLSYPLVI